MHDYALEFSKVAVAHLLAVASPGPDFAVVLRQSFAHGRRVALWTSVGVGAAILWHIGYSLLGLGLLLRSSATWFGVAKYAAAAYLAWLGVQALRSPPRTAPDENPAVAPARLPAARGAFATGFLTNALNPKATLFFVALFATVVSPQTPKWVQGAYGVWMSVMTMAWFCLVSVVFARDEVRRSFLRRGHWIDRALGVVFIGFAASLAFGSLT